MEIKNVWCSWLINNLIYYRNSCKIIFCLTTNTPFHYHFILALSRASRHTFLYSRSPSYSYIHCVCLWPVPMMVPKTTSETLKHKINPSLGLAEPQTVHVLLYTPGTVEFRSYLIVCVIILCSLLFIFNAHHSHTVHLLVVFLLILTVQSMKEVSL